MTADFITHEVQNQPPLLGPHNPWTTDLALQAAIAREGGGAGADDIAAYGAQIGGPMQELAAQANENKPKLRLFDRYGHRVDEVEFHPAYHRLMALGIEHGCTGYAWRRADKPGAHVTRMGILYMHNQADQGTGCPITMTYACVPTLRKHEAWSKLLLPLVTAPSYDARPIFSGDKTGVTFGMGMTEKQGGSDVRSNTTRATRVATDELGDRYALIGHKWFFSAPMSDAFFVLAQAEGGLTCFLLPRILPDGSRNTVRIQRLKDKVGDWSNASSEVEFQNAQAWRVGDEGRGVANILQMVALTRLDCMIGSASTMRQALTLAIHHTRHRRAFGKLLIDQPLMTNVLADLALDSEAHVALTARVARAIDRSEADPAQAAFARIATAVGKYWICKRTPAFVNEAQECHGGIGYVEESTIARLYRQAPLNSIWEGSGNVQCLDVLRAIHRDEGALTAILAELDAARGGHPALDAEIDSLRAMFADPADLEVRARFIVERLALALQASLLVRADNPLIADAFCAARLATSARAYGTLAAHVNHRAIVDRAAGI
jgi:putative acyl-CoA dehydrogenase